MNTDFTGAKAVIARGLSGPTDRIGMRLSEREFAVMKGIANGDSINDISKRLFMSPSTASTYRKRVLAKLGFTNNAQIVLFVHNELGQ